MTWAARRPPQSPTRSWILHVTMLTGPSLTMSGASMKSLLFRRILLMALSIHDPEADRLAGELAAIRRSCASLLVLDAHSDDEILGYDHHGLPD